MKKNILIIIGIVAAALSLLAQTGRKPFPTNSFVGGVGGSSGSSSTTSSNTVVIARGSADARFLAQAAEADLHVIALGNLAQVNSFNSGVQAFGVTLVQDGTASFQQVVDIANANGIFIPSAQNVQDANDEVALSRLTGSQFDTAFLSEMVTLHTREILLFETEAQRGRNADVRAFAQAQLPVLATHLSTALMLEDSLGLLPSVR